MSSQRFINPQDAKAKRSFWQLFKDELRYYRYLNNTIKNQRP